LRTASSPCYDGIVVGRVGARVEAASSSGNGRPSSPSAPSTGTLLLALAGWAVVGCQAPSFDPELVPSEVDCADGVDDDLDGWTDGLDPDCWDQTELSVRACPSVPGTTDATPDSPRRLSTDPEAWDGDLPSVAAADGLPDGGFFVEDPETALVAVSDEAFTGGLSRTRFMARIVSTSPRVCIGVVPAERALPNPEVLLGDGLASCFAPGNGADTPPDLQLRGVRTAPVNADRAGWAFPPGLPAHLDLDIEAPSARVRLAAGDGPSGRYLDEILPPTLGRTDPVHAFVVVQPGTGTVTVSELGFVRGRGDTCPQVRSPSLFDADADGGSDLRGLALARDPSRAADGEGRSDPGTAELTACAFVATGARGQAVGVWRSADGGRRFIRGPDLLPGVAGTIRGAALTRGVCGGFAGYAVVETGDPALSTVRFRSEDCRAFEADPPQAAPASLADSTLVLAHLSVLPGIDAAGAGIDAAGGACADHVELAVPMVRDGNEPAFRRFLEDGSGGLTPAGDLVLRPRDIALANDCVQSTGPTTGPPVFAAMGFQVARVGADLVFFGPDGGDAGEWSFWRTDLRDEPGCPDAADFRDRGILLVSPATDARLRPSGLPGAFDETEIGTARFALDPLAIGTSRYGLVLYGGAVNVGCRDCGRAVGPAFLGLGALR
jgi:hypothetical protein